MEDLWERARRTSERALAAGALGPIDTEETRVEDGGIEFSLRVVSSLARKERAARSRPPTEDPFSPWEEALFVGAVGPDHALLLNKFPVFADHLLLVTRHFEDQEALLTEADFAALARCLDGTEALVFYNAGRVAGASQRHKHLQLVPVPLADGPEAAPVERALARGALPFAHAATATPADPTRWHAAYLELLRAVRCEVPPAPYDLLMTRAWMLAVPRSRERFDGISVNALGFAGSLLARDRSELERLREAGPLRVLAHVSRPAPRPLEVVAHAGHRGAQEPRALIVEGVRREVAEVVRRWREPDGDRFVVRTADGATWRLVHRDAEGWSFG
jgi:ATP adenylyltransferase